MCTLWDPISFINGTGSRRVHTIYVPERCSTFVWWWLLMIDSVHSMGSHRVHTTHVPECCSTLAWWWLFTARTCRLKSFTNNWLSYFLTNIVVSLDGNKIPILWIMLKKNLRAESTDVKPVWHRSGQNNIALQSWFLNLEMIQSLCILRWIYCSKKTAVCFFCGPLKYCLQ